MPLRRPLLILFVKLDLGGIETYFAKLSHELAISRDIVAVSMKDGRDPGLLRLFHSSVRFIDAKNIRKLRQCFPFGVDMVATGRNTALYGLALKALLPGKSRIRFGLYSQYEMEERSQGLLAPVYRFAFRLIGPECTYFCTQGLKGRQVRRDNRYAASPVVPLSVSFPGFCRYDLSQTTALRLVTIGRFVSFKKYLFVLPDVIASLRSQGIAVSLDIYGYGPLEADLRARIDACAGGAFIHLMGKLEPLRIDEVLMNCDVFVGSGSVLLEAASRGVPSIVCIDSNEEATSPGYIHELPLFFTSEEREGIPMVSLIDLIKRLSTLSISERNAFRMASFQYCKPYYPDRVADLLLSVVDKPC